jgi:lactoylglutathione lyase
MIGGVILGDVIVVNFAYTILYVEDVAKSIAFYEMAFGFVRRFIHESGDYGELETGGTALAFAANELGTSNFPNGFIRNDRANPPAGIEIALTSDDVVATFAQAVAAGAIALMAPTEKPWGQTVAYVRDLDGVLVEICSPMG